MKQFVLHAECDQFEPDDPEYHRMSIIHDCNNNCPAFLMLEDVEWKVSVPKKFYYL